MKKALVIILVLIMVFTVAGCQSTNKADDGKLMVAASVVPVASWVKQVAGDNVEVLTVIPPGNSPANYQPTTTEMQSLSEADIYFVVQVPTEEANILTKIDDFNPDVQLVNLRDEVSAVYPMRYMSEHHHDGDEEEDHDHDADAEEEHEHGEEEQTIDPHIWLSPQRAMVMVQVIADTLSEQDSANADTYQSNAAAYIEELKAADENIKQIVNNMDKKAFMIYHGSYGYFADDYGLEMIALESDGKEATAARMQELVEEAETQGIKTIFYQDEFDDNQAKTIAEELDGVVQNTSPLSADYVDSLIAFAEALAGK